MGIYVATASAMAITTGSARTLLQVTTGASERARIVEWGVSFNGTSAADAPALIEILRQTTAGTGGTSVTPSPGDPGDAASTTTALKGQWSAEPTAGDILGSYYLTPNGGLFEIQMPLTREIIVGNSGRFAVRCTVNANVTAAANIVFEEW